MKLLKNLVRMDVLRKRSWVASILYYYYLVIVFFTFLSMILVAAVVITVGFGMSDQKLKSNLQSSRGYLDSLGH